jgi:hypothetical protein
MKIFSKTDQVALPTKTTLKKQESRQRVKEGETYRTIARNTSFADAISK